MPQEDPGRWSVKELRAFLAARGDATCAHATEKKELAAVWLFEVTDECQWRPGGAPRGAARLELAGRRGETSLRLPVQLLSKPQYANIHVRIPLGVRLQHIFFRS